MALESSSDADMNNNTRQQVTENSERKPLLVIMSHVENYIPLKNIQGNEVSIQAIALNDKQPKLSIKNSAQYIATASSLHAESYHWYSFNDKQTKLMKIIVITL